MDLMDPLPVEVDTAQVMAALRDAVSGRGVVDAVGHGQRSHQPGVSWNRVFVQVTDAERHAAIGSMVPTLQRYHPAIRPLARFVAACVLYAARFVITPQRLFNLAALRAIRTLADCIREDAIRLSTTETRIEKLEQKIAGQAAHIELLAGAVEGNSELTRTQLTGEPSPSVAEFHRAAG